MHTSNTESILQWPHFDGFPSLRNDYKSNFRLEQERSPVKTNSRSVYPYISPEETDSILQSFQRTVNFWYPTLSTSHLETARCMVNSGSFEGDSVEVCLSLLIMALGCASEVVSGELGETTSGTDTTDKQRSVSTRRRGLGAIYFNSALKRLHFTSLEVTSATAHCLFFAALVVPVLAAVFLGSSHVADTI